MKKKNANASYNKHLFRPKWTSSVPLPYRNVKFRYAEDVAMTPSTTVATRTFRANSLFDTNETGVGHQPLGFDEWSAFYHKYRVYGCAVKFTGCINNIARVGIGFSNISTGISGLADMNETLEQSMVRSKITNGNNNTFSVNYYMPIYKVVGCSKLKIQIDDLYSAGVGANPSDIVYFTLFGQNVDGFTSTSITGRVQITFYATMFDRKTLSSS